MQKLTIAELDRFTIQRHPMTVMMYEELFALYDQERDVIGLVMRDKIDDDYSFVILARETDKAPYRAIDLGTNNPTPEAAEVTVKERVGVLPNKVHRERND